MNANLNGGSHLPTTRTPGSGTYVAVGVKRCCNVLIGEQCDCREFEAEARAALTGRNAIMCRPASQWNRDPATALGIALHRDGGVVFDRVIEAESFSKAAKKAERLTAEDGDFRGFSVYSITRGYTS